MRNMGWGSMQKVHPHTVPTHMCMGCVSVGQTLPLWHTPAGNARCDFRSPTPCHSLPAEQMNEGMAPLTCSSNWHGSAWMGTAHTPICMTLLCGVPPLPPPLVHEGDTQEGAMWDPEAEVWLATRWPLEGHTWSQQCLGGGGLGPHKWWGGPHVTGWAPFCTQRLGVVPAAVWRPPPPMCLGRAYGPRSSLPLSLHV